MFNEPKKDLDAPRELRTRITFGTLAKLHFLKVKTGKSIGSLVEEALIKYFESLKEEK